MFTLTTLRLGWTLLEFTLSKTHKTQNNHTQFPNLSCKALEIALTNRTLS